MSLVASEARQHGTKRFLESDHNLKNIILEADGCSKRARHSTGWEALGTLGERDGGNLAYAVDLGLGGGPTLLALRALFPHMTDQAITNALAEFGDNVDAAIKHLNALNLSFDQPSESPVVHDHGEQSRHQKGKGNSDVGRLERWTDILVDEMSKAKDVGDAKARASAVLVDFQNEIYTTSTTPNKDQKVGLTNDRNDLGGGTSQELVKENMILKRAVAIQNSRLHELAGKDGQVKELELALRAANEKIHALEVQNYGLQVHLRRATEQCTSEKYSGTLNNPDVF